MRALLFLSLALFANVVTGKEKVPENWHCWAGASNTYQIPVTLLKAIAKQESGFYPYALNKNPNGSYDIGLMQINTAWLKKGGVLEKRGITVQSLYEPCMNLYVGAWVLRNNINRFGYNWRAVGAYNAATEWKRVRYANNVWKHVKDIENKKVVK